MEDSDGVKQKEQKPKNNAKPKTTCNAIMITLFCVVPHRLKNYDFNKFAFLQISPDEDFDPRMLDQVRSKLKKRKMGNEEKDDLDEKMVKDPSGKRLVHYEK